jgi:hypothetical protein
MLQDEVFHKMAGLKREHRGKTDAFFNNRRFSRNIRELCKAGKEDEARAECEKQVLRTLILIDRGVMDFLQYISAWGKYR